MTPITFRIPIFLATATCGLLYATSLIANVTQAQGTPETPRPVTSTARQTQSIKLSGMWRVDPMHTNINFAVRHSVVNLVQSRLRINRQDYGVKWNQVLDNGGLAVGNDVDIEINLEAIPPKPEGHTGEKSAVK